LEVLREADVETHMVISSAAKKIILMETDFTVEEGEAMADYMRAIIFPRCPLFTIGPTQSRRYH
jgi:3-polyprenyl-4-hydroxybenzoate decarboxylase